MGCGPGIDLLIAANILCTYYSSQSLSIRRCVNKPFPTKQVIVAIVSFSLFGVEVQRNEFQILA